MPEDDHTRDDESQQHSSAVQAIISGESATTRLHIACLFGDADFAREILTLYPETISQQLNQYTPSHLHLAATKAHLEAVRLLLEFGRQQAVVERLCLKKDLHGKTPLHCAVIAGQLDIIRELLVACPDSVSQMTNQGETVLHLAVKNNQIETFLFLVEEPLTFSLLNLADSHGNTVMHLASLLQQSQILKFLNSQPIVDVNAVNSDGLLAMDLLVLGQQTGQNPPAWPNNTENEASQPSQEASEDRGTVRDLEDMKDGLLIMASLVASVTCQIAFNPPGGFWQDWSSTSNDTAASNSNHTVPGHIPGNSILYDRDQQQYRTFIFMNTQAFLVSLFLITILATPRLPTRLARVKWGVIPHLIQYMVTSVVVLFYLGVSFTTKRTIYKTAEHYVFDTFWVVCMFVIILSTFYRRLRF